jgi:transmembrane sensor
MRYEDYQLMDFVNDSYFIEWVKNPSLESNTFWQAWLEEHPDKQELIEQARELLAFLTFKTEQPSVEEQLLVKSAIKKRIRTEAHSGVLVFPKQINKTTTDRKPIHYWRPYYKIAALCTGILFCAAILLLFKLGYTQKAYYTKYGQTRTIDLPDGSTVVLNANSSLYYNNDWQQSKLREVWLDGEAFFQVRRKPHWKEARFIVHTNQLNIEVLGTSFNVNNRRGVVKVVLNSGKVKLRHIGNITDSLVMQPKDLVEFEDHSQAFSKKTVEPEVYSSWRHNKLIFNDTPVKEIAQLLEDNYGMQVTFKDAQLANRKFTGSIPNQDIDLFLTILAESLNIDISRENQLIMISTLTPKNL